MNKILLKLPERQLTDNALLQAIATSADTKAFLTLYDRYSQRILQYFRRAIDDVDAVRDLSQNFWLHIWLNASRLIYEGNDSVEKIFFSMAARRIADYYRSPGYKRDASLDDSPTVSQEESTLPSPESDCYSEEIRSVTERVLDKYPELDKQIFICQKELDYPAQQTASLFDISVECIYKKVSLIMKDLRLQLRLAGYY